MSAEHDVFQNLQDKSYSSDSQSTLSVSQRRSLRVVTDSIIAFAQHKGILFQTASQIGSEQGFGNNLNKMERYTCCPGQYSDQANADIKKGMNLFCGCVNCGSKENPKGFIINLDIKRIWNIPRIMKAAECPHCKGTPKQQSTIVTTFGFYDCEWKIQGEIKGTNQEFQPIQDKTPILDITYFLPSQKEEKLEFSYLLITCKELNEK